MFFPAAPLNAAPVGNKKIDLPKIRSTSQQEEKIIQGNEWWVKLF